MGILDNDVRPVLSSKTYIFVAVELVQVRRYH